MRIFQIPGLIDNIFFEKMIMVKGDELIVGNVYISILQYIGEVIKLDTCKWFELIAGLFYLQMTIL